MKKIYGVPEIEIEFGQRPFGWHLYLYESDCVENTIKRSRTGAYSGGYIGPIRPLHYFLIPHDCLDDKYKHILKIHGRCKTADEWKPEFLSRKIPIISG